MVNDYATRIIDLYTEYISWSAELMRSFGGVKIFSQLFTGGGQYKNREEHRSFFKAVDEVAGEYYAALKNGDAPRREAMEILYYVLIGCHGSVDEWGDWMLMAAEKHFVFSVSRIDALKLQVRRDGLIFYHKFDILFADAVSFSSK